MCGERAYELAHTAHETKPRRDDDEWTDDLTSLKMRHLSNRLDRFVSGHPVRTARLSPRDVRLLRDGTGWVSG